MANALAAKVQLLWAERPIAERTKILARWRGKIACRTNELTKAIAAEPMRTDADVRVSEILPLLAACQFLERNAGKILKAQSLGRTGRPWWLSGVRAEIHRVALGSILVIGPSNYPLFLPGVQVLQALVAGNSVVWKPGRGGLAVATLFVDSLRDAGLPEELVTVTQESVKAGQEAIAAGPDKVFFTGSAENGRVVMRLLAERAIPSVMELSGCSSVVVLPHADLGRVAAAVAFGTRLNGAATCMAPRRIIVVGQTLARRSALVERLSLALATIMPVRLSVDLQKDLWSLVEEARVQGASVFGQVELEKGAGQAPLLLVGVTPAMRIAQSDIFAPVLSVVDVADQEGVFLAERACPYALSVSIFGDELEARQLASRITMGTVVINDLIVPTADPRIPFGGRRASGFGVTRGAEGLLEMTAVKTILVRSGASQRHYEPTSTQHTKLFDGLIAAAHGSTWSARWAGLQAVASAVLGMKSIGSKT